MSDTKTFMADRADPGGEAVRAVRLAILSRLPPVDEAPAQLLGAAIHAPGGAQA